MHTIGDHTLEWGADMPSYYGQCGVTAHQRCTKCNYTWHYNTDAKIIEAIPCLDDQVAMNTIKEIQRIRYEIESLTKRIEHIREMCPHHYTKEGKTVTEGFRSLAMSTRCLVCGKYVSSRPLNKEEREADIKCGGNMSYFLPEKSYILTKKETDQ